MQLHPTRRQPVNSSPMPFPDKSMNLSADNTTIDQISWTLQPSCRKYAFPRIPMLWLYKWLHDVQFYLWELHPLHKDEAEMLQYIRVPNLISNMQGYLNPSSKFSIIINRFVGDILRLKTDYHRSRLRIHTIHTHSCMFFWKSNIKCRIITQKAKILPQQMQ